VRLADAIAQRVGQQRFNVWFNPSSTRLDLRNDGLEIAVPNDFISEWIGRHYARSIQEAAHEVLGGPLTVRFSVVPQLFEVKNGPREGETAATPSARTNGTHANRLNGNSNGSHRKGANGRARGFTSSRPTAAPTPPALANGNGNGNGKAHVNGNGAATSVAAIAGKIAAAQPILRTAPSTDRDSALTVFANRPRLRHDPNRSSWAPATSSRSTPQPTLPSSPDRSTTRCSFTATAGSARRTCSRACASDSPSTIRPSAGCT
jgi:chromosomal replication initiation ATPase DnaA